MVCLFRCQWGSESVVFSVSSVSVAFRVCTVQWVILRLHSSVSAVFRALAVTTSLSCSESTLWRSSAPAQFSSFNIPSTTEGHLRTKYKVKLLFLNPLTYQCTMVHVLVRGYFWWVLTGGTYPSALGSQQRILISASTVSHCGSPVWKNGSCSEHQCTGCWRSTVVIILCQC